jgi:hypothetical protein
MAEQSSLSPPIDSDLFYKAYTPIFRKLFLACGGEVLPIRTQLIACGRMVLTIFCGSFFAPQGEKPGALWATEEEKEHSAEG